MFCSCGSSGRHAVTVAAITRRYHVASESVTDTLLTDCEELYNTHSTQMALMTQMNFETFSKTAHKNLSTQYFGHLIRAENLSTLILHKRINRKRAQGRLKQQWTDDLKN